MVAALPYAWASGSGDEDLDSGYIKGRVTKDERPRKTLNFEIPAERFGQCVASTD